MGALPPILPIAAHHPKPTPVVPRLREEPHRPTLNSPQSHYCAPFPPLTALPFPRRGAPRGRPPPHPTPCDDHPVPSPAPFRGPANNPRRPLPNTPPSHYCAPFPPPTALLFPHMTVPRGRPSPHPTPCDAPSCAFPCHSEAPRGISPPHTQHPSIPLLCAIPTAHHTTPSPVGASLVGALPPPVVLAHAGTHPPCPWPRVTLSTAEPKNLAAPLSTPLHPFIY